jgi:hypothetical protein
VCARIKPEETNKGYEIEDSQGGVSILVFWMYTAECKLLDVHLNIHPLLDK